MLPAQFIICGLFLLPACNYNAKNTSGNTFQPTKVVAASTDNTYPVVSAIPLPAGFKRPEAGESSFIKWLGKIKLKKDKTVYLFNGKIKPYQGAQFAVLDISVGKQDLQQCADAVMRLRAEYLFAGKKFAEIDFKDNDGKNYAFTAPYSNPHFEQYLNLVFSACGTASLSKQLHPKSMKDLQAGDVFIRAGFPGHAVIVMDAAYDSAGEKIFLLAQSYMPAQDIHILLNPVDSKISPWYKVGSAEKIITPQYIFNNNELKEW